MVSIWQTSAAIFVVALVCFSGCTRHRDPQALFDHAKQTFRKGDIAAAESEAEAGYKEFHNLSADWAWKFRLLQARALVWQGRNKEAIDLLSLAGSPLDEEFTVQKLVLESGAYTTLHDSSEADNRLRKAEDLCSRADCPSCAELTSVIGSQHMNRGEFAQAEKYFQRELVLAKAHGNASLEAFAYLNLSWAADEQIHFDEALDWASAARDISVHSHFDDMAQASLGNMAWAYYKLGDLERAEGMFLDAGKQAEKLGNFSDEVKWLTNAGYTYMDEGKIPIAESSFIGSLNLARKNKNPGDIINSLIALAFVSEQTSKLDDAQRYADEALKMALADGNKRDQTYPKLVQGRIAAQQHDAVAAQTALEEVVDSPDATVSLKWEAQRSLARLYEDERQYEGARREYRAALTTFEGARSELKHDDSRLPFLNNASRIYDDYIHFLVKQGKSDEALQAAEYNRARTLNEELGVLKKGSSFQPDPLNASQIARQAAGTIFFYWLGEKESYLWLIGPGVSGAKIKKTTLFTLPAESEIDAAVQRYRKALTGPNDPVAESNRDGLALYKMLVEPARDLLPKNKDANVYIVPDGSLNTLNFETLIVSDPRPHYWIEDATVTNASSLRLLASSRRVIINGNKPSLLLLGDAVATSTDYPELRKAGAEMESIARHFGSAQQRVFTRDKATPSAYLKASPETFSYIHFVAHGTASRVSPLDSAIVLSKDVLSKNGAENDSFKLYARDIIHRPLRADLVTISTCYGAGTRAYSGEGLVGLSWAFLRAGAHNVIGALWEVSDVSTPVLMNNLYTGLEKKQAPAAALRAAKLSMLHSSDAFHRPFYWAPFQLYTGS
jgi:CHAT domain-containing protein